MEQLLYLGVISKRRCLHTFAKARLEESQDTGKAGEQARRERWRLQKPWPDTSHIPGPAPREPTWQDNQIPKAPGSAPPGFASAAAFRSNWQQSQALDSSPSTECVFFFLFKQPDLHVQKMEVGIAFSYLRWRARFKAVVLRHFSFSLLDLEGAISSGV